MDSRGSREIVRANKFFASGQSQLHVLSNAGHQLFMDNPTEFVELVRDDLLGHVTHGFKIRRYSTNYVDDNDNLTHTDVEFQEYGSAGNRPFIPQ